MYLLSIFPFLQGTNELHIVFALDIILLLLIFLRIYKNKKIIFTKDIKFILILIWAASYLVTMLYSADTELAFLGFLKFFSVPLFITLIMQYKYDVEERSQWFEAIGKIGAVMVIICILSIFIGKSDVFFYQNRLAGFFNYANSFAMFLLIGLISTGFKKELRLIDYAVMGVLLVGIILTNSRSLMIITAFSYVLVLIFSKVNKKTKLLNSAIMVVVAVSTILIAGAFGVSNRISTTSGNASEWVLRLLYYKDALRMISENIFGYGHMAWWYMQEGLQTGVYDAQYIHNGLLQVAVDAGVIPALLIVIVFIKAFFEKNRNSRDKILMIIILGHALIDFDMEFLAITLPLFMTLEFDKLIEIKNIVMAKLGICLGIIVYGFFSIVTVFGKIGAYDKANSIFPYSFNLDKELLNETDSTKMLEIAEKLYEKNKYFVNSAKILSEKEQAENNYEKANEYEWWIVENKKYTMRNYIEYVKFIEDSIEYYSSRGDIDSIKVCVSKIEAVISRINDVLATSDELAYKIAHKPRLTIPDELITYLNNLNLYIQRVEN